MSLWHPDPPQGFTSEQGQIIIGRPMIPLIGAPQGVGEPIDLKDPLLALFPPIGDVTYQFYKFYQINKNQVPTIQTNMPVAIIDTLGAGILQEVSGFDIRVFDSAGVPIPYEVELVNIITGEIIVWVNVTTVNDLEFIQLTFGKPSATDGSNSGAVYDANYKGVYHLNQTTFGVGDIIDSTSNGNDGDGVETTGSLASVVGQIGQAIRFGTSVGDRTAIDLGGNVMPTMATVGTVSMWASINNLAAGTDFQMYFSMRGTNTWEVFYQKSDDTIQFRYGDSGEELILSNASTIISDGVKHYYSFCWNQPDGTVRMYIDAVLVASKTVTPWTLPIADNGVNLGNIETVISVTNLIGFEDESRFSNIERSIDWINTEFNNQNDNNTFWFKTPLLENGVDNFLVDDMGRNIVATGQ